MADPALPTESLPEVLPQSLPEASELAASGKILPVHGHTLPDIAAAPATKVEAHTRTALQTAQLASDAIRSAVQPANLPGRPAPIAQLTEKAAEPPINPMAPARPDPRLAATAKPGETASAPALATLPETPPVVGGRPDPRLTEAKLAEFARPTASSGSAASAVFTLPLTQQQSAGYIPRSDQPQPVPQAQTRAVQTAPVAAALQAASVPLDPRAVLAAAAPASQAEALPDAVPTGTETLVSQPKTLTDALPARRSASDALRAPAADLPGDSQAPTPAAPAASTAASTAATTAADAPRVATIISAQTGPETAASTAPTASAPTSASAARHDFEAIVDRLTEAREMSRTNRADLQVPHREFGRVSVQFEMTGQSLRVALSSHDAAFASSVQVALADRPIAALADAARSDSQTARQDTASQSQGQSQGQAQGQSAAQSDAQRQEQQARTAAARQTAEQAQRQPRGDGDRTDNSAQRGRGSDLFA